MTYSGSGSDTLNLLQVLDASKKMCSLLALRYAPGGAPPQMHTSVTGESVALATPVNRRGSQTEDPVHGFYHHRA
jgi:hypothetical protein